MDTGRKNSQGENSGSDAYFASDFRHEGENGNESWDYQYMANVIEEFHNFKYISEDDTDQLFIQEDGIWKEKGESTVTNLCMELTNEAMFSQRAINNVKQIVQNRNRIYKEENFFQPPERLVPFKNGVYDVEEDEFRPYQDDDNFRFKHDVEFVENPEEKEDNGKVEDFLETIQNSRRKKEILKEVAGLALLPDFPIDKAPVLYGEGSNGKNKFVELLDKISGTYHSINLEDYTGDDFASAEVENTTLVFFDEFQDIDSPSKLKSFIGSDKIRVRHMQQEGYMAEQIALPVLAANELPTPPEQKTSFFRRWEVIDFPHKFTAAENDGNKDMLSDEEIEIRYWTDQALNCFASKAVRKLGDLIERQDYSEGQTPEEVKHIWNNRSYPVYTFLDKFVEQGRLPRQGTEDAADTVIKERLLNMVNDYLDLLDGSEVQMGQLTSAIKKTNEVETSTHRDVTVAEGKTKKAYTGIKLTLPDMHDSNQVNQLDNSRIMKLVREYWTVFSDLQTSKEAHIPAIAQIDEVREALKFLHHLDNKQASLLELIKGLDLEEEGIEKIRDSQFVDFVNNADKIQRFPKVKIDEETFNQAINESDEVIEDSGDYLRPSRFVQDRIQNMTQNQEVQIDDYFIDPGKEKGFSEEKLEKAVSDAKGNELAKTPTPGKLRLM